MVDEAERDDLALKEQMQEDQIEKQIWEDANDVLNASVSYAKRMLRRHGSFAPFSHRMNRDGKVALEMVAQHDMPPEPAFLLELLYQQLAERAGKGLLLAAATASNVTLGAPTPEGYTDAVMVEIEHKSGYCMLAFVPYRLSGGRFYPILPRVVRFGAMQTQEGTPRLFRR